MNTPTPRRGTNALLALCWVVMLAGTAGAFGVGQVVAGIACVLLTGAAGVQWWAVRREMAEREGRLFGHKEEKQ